MRLLPLVSSLFSSFLVFNTDFLLPYRVAVTHIHFVTYNTFMFWNLVVHASRIVYVGNCGIRSGRLQHVQACR